MEKYANGEKLATDIKSIFIFNNMYYFVRLIFGFIIIVILSTKVGELLNKNIINVLVAFFLFGAPASAVILMMEKRFLSLINPRKIVEIIRLFGTAYLLLYMLIAIGLLIYLSLNSAASGSGNSLEILLLVDSLAVYLLVVLFAMMGYLVLQFHYELNYRVRLHCVDSNAKLSSSPMANVEIFIQEGRFEDAQKLLLEKITTNGMDVSANERLILLYVFQGKDNYAQKIIEVYFELLIKNKKQKQAADFYCKLRGKEIKISQQGSQTALAMIREMHNRNQYSVALELIHRYSCRPGKETYWDEFALEEAIILDEYENSQREVAALLELIIKRSLNQSLLELAQFRLDNID